MEIYISRVHVSCQRTQQIRDKLDMFTQIRFICADVFDFMSASIQEHTRARVRRHLFHLCDMTYDVSIAGEARSVWRPEEVTTAWQFQ